MSSDVPGRVITGKVRLSWPKLFKPESFIDASGRATEPKFSTVVLLPKTDTDTLGKLREAEKVIAELQKDKFPGGKVPKKLQSIIRDGDGENEKTGELYAERYPEREGHWFFSVSANADRKPGLVDQQMNDIIDPSEIYSGVYARLALQAFAYSNMGNVGVSFGLNHVQKWADGEPFAGVTKASDVFDALDDDDLV